MKEENRLSYFDSNLNKERLLKMQEAANFLSISVRALYRLIAKGELPQPLKIGRSSRISSLQLMRYLQRLQNGVKV